MGHARGNMRHIAGAQLLACSVFDRITTNLARCDCLRFCHGAARHEGGTTFENQKQVGEVLMQLSASAAAAIEKQDRVLRVFLDRLAGRSFTKFRDFTQIRNAFQNDRQGEMIESFASRIELFIRRTDGSASLGRSSFRNAFSKMSMSFASSPSTTSTGHFACSPKDIEKHRSRKFPRIGVLQRWMVAGDRLQAAWQRVFRSMTEDESCSRFHLSCALLMSQQAVKRDAPKADDDPQVLQGAQLLIEPWGTVAQLVWCRLVSWWCAAGNGRDPQSGKPHAVFA